MVFGWKNENQKITLKLKAVFAALFGASKKCETEVKNECQNASVMLSFDPDEYQERMVEVDTDMQENIQSITNNAQCSSEF